MNKNYTNISNLNFILCGLAFTSRTETLEDYLKDKVNSLTVISLSSCFLKENLSSCRVYEKGILKDEFRIPNFRIKDYKWYRQPLILLVFVVNWLSIGITLFKLRRRFDLFIGVSHSFAFLGSVLKKVRIVKSLIYYCGDYYIPTSKIEFNTLFVRLVNILDRFTVKHADYIWDVSPNIAEYREKIGKIKKERYKKIIVPLGYSKHLRRYKPAEEINRWDIGFVGTITANQGLQLLVEAMPEILVKLPKARVKLIGEGPFLEELKKMVTEKGLGDYFTFFGFIKEEDKMLDILSRCAIGVALWSGSLENRNITSADPGKTKLYALCGLPIIVTKVCSISEVIQNKRAGIAIDYKEDNLKEGIIYLMGNDERLKEFKLNSFNLGGSYISDDIFNRAFKILEVNAK